MTATTTSDAATVDVRRRGKRSKGDRREAQILEAARTLLRERPFAAVTIDDLASAAGISRTGFYFYFPTKQAVLAALIEQVWSDFGATHAWFETAGPSPDALREQMTAALAVWREHGPVLACTLSHDDERYPPLEQFATRARSRFVDGLAAKIERDRAAGAAPDGIAPRTLAELVLDLRDARMARVTTDVGAPPEPEGRQLGGQLGTQESGEASGQAGEQGGEQGGEQASEAVVADVVADVVEAVLRLIYGRWT